MGSAFHQLCPRYSGTLTPTAPMAIRLWDTFTFTLAGDHLYGKLLFPWLSLVMSLMVLFVLSFFPRDVLDEILDLIESVSDGFPTYS